MRNPRFNLTAIAAGFVAVAVVANAQVTVVAGAGSRSCAQMQADVAELPNVRRAYVSWMQGYLSGANAARESSGLGLIDLADYEAQWAWLTQWCDGHSTSTFAEAVAELFSEQLGKTSID